MSSKKLIDIHCNAERLREMVKWRIFVVSMIVLLTMTLCVPVFLGWGKGNIWYGAFWVYACLNPPNPHHDTVCRLHDLSSYALDSISYSEEWKAERLINAQQRWERCLGSLWAVGLCGYFSE